MNAEQFRTAMQARPEPPTDSKPPLWDYWRHELWQKVSSGEDPYTFPTWPPIYHTMLVNHWKEYIKIEFEHLSHNLPRWGPAILATGPEKPKDYFLDSLYSRNLIHQAYHISQWEDATGRRIEDCQTILEFGGGYGAMALVARRLGFKGEYAIWDSPEFSLLQQFYLANASVGNVSFGEPYADRVDLVIACYSLSEVDIEYRDKFFKNLRLMELLHPATSYLFLYSDRFVDYDNVAYFQQTMPLLDSGQWTHTPVDHLPPASWYTFGH